jgi:hypothetical protein
MADRDLKPYTAMLVGPVGSLGGFSDTALVLVHVLAVDAGAAREVGQERAAAHLAELGATHEPDEFEPHLVIEGHVHIADWDPYSLTVRTLPSEAQQARRPTKAQSLARGDGLAIAKDRTPGKDLEPGR